MSDAPHPAPPSRNARILLAFARTIAALAAFFFTLYWVEAEKEARVLCGLSKTGAAADKVDRLFKTANLLRVRSETDGNRRTLHVASVPNLALSGCTVTIDGDVVTNWSFVERLRSGPVASVALLLGLVWLVILHLRNLVRAPAPAADSPTWMRVAKRVFATMREILPATLALLGIAALLDFSQLISLPPITPFSGAIGILLVLFFLAAFVVAPVRGTTRVGRSAERLFPLVMACCGVVVLLGG